MISKEQNPHQLCGAIKISKSGDGILVPVFSCYPLNKYYVASTKDDMEIYKFDELDILFDYIVPVPAHEYKKSQYIIGDTSPIIYCENNKIQCAAEDDIDNIIQSLKSIPDHGAIVKELIDRLITLSLAEKENFRKEDERWSEKNIPIQPRPAKLWLDVAIEDLDERYGRKIYDELTKSKVRNQLLAWAADISSAVTTPIFNHFVWAVQKVERQGVYVQDILGTAIVNRLTGGVARVDRLTDLIKNYRMRYNRSPLSAVHELSEHSVAKLSEWADKTSEKYYKFIRSKLKKFAPYDILTMTFAADGGQWPEDIQKNLQNVKAHHERNLSKMLETRKEISNYIEKSPRNKDYWELRPSQQRRLATLSSQIINEITYIDSLNKSISSDPKYSHYSERFTRVDFQSIGFNADFFLSLDRSRREEQAM